jgi:hypothetical protein
MGGRAKTALHRPESGAKHRASGASIREYPTRMGLGLGLPTWSRRRSFRSARRCGPPSTYPFRTCAVVRLERGWSAQHARCAVQRANVRRVHVTERRSPTDGQPWPTPWSFCAWPSGRKAVSCAAGDVACPIPRTMAHGRTGARHRLMPDAPIPRNFGQLALPRRWCGCRGEGPRSIGWCRSPGFAPHLRGSAFGIGASGNRL